MNSSREDAKKDRGRVVFVFHLDQSKGKSWINRNQGRPRKTFASSLLRVHQTSKVRP